MKKVEFVRVKSSINGFAPMKGPTNTFKDVEKIIKERIEKGWEFAGSVPITTRGTGEIETMSLVFHKNQ